MMPVSALLTLWARLPARRRINPSSASFVAAYGLFGIGAGAAPRQRGTVGLYHLASQVDTIDELEEARRTLVELGAFTGESSHGATKSVYGVDPDGNEFEVMWMLPRSDWGEYVNSAPVDRLDLGAEVQRWSGIGTAGRLVAGSADALAGEQA